MMRSGVSICLAEGARYMLNADVTGENTRGKDR